jgi:primosomal protein N'
VNGPLETAQLAGQNCFVATLPPEKNQAAERPLRPFWPHQERTLTEIRARALAGRSRVAIQIATGGGKTRLAVEVAKNALAKGRRVAIIILRISLVDQWLRAFSAEGVDCVGVMQAVACEYVDAFVDRRERELIFERFRGGEFGGNTPQSEAPQTGAGGLWRPQMISAPQAALIRIDRPRWNKVMV